MTDAKLYLTNLLVCLELYFISDESVIVFFRTLKCIVKLEIEHLNLQNI